MRLALAALALLCSLPAFPAATAVPTPESRFGHRMGADRTVLDWDRVVSYFRALESTSGRVRVREYGKSTEGRPMIAALIASPATLRSLDTFLLMQRRLADPRGLRYLAAVRLFDSGKAVVMITCSIHATEIASTHAAVAFAYRMATANDANTRAILDNVILILVPSLNPDGLDLVTRWYRRTLGTPYEGTAPPELYQKYAGHDNNRDWYMFTQAETRATVSQLHNVWHPQIVYDVHQQGPNASRMFVPPWMDPIEPNIDPILVQSCNMIGTGMALDLTAAGKTGVVINALYDLWTPARHYQAYHGGLRILSETASVRIATPIVVRPEDIERTGPGYSPRERSWNYLQPWTGGEWRLADIVDYQLIAMESVLYQAAIRRRDLLENFYTIGRRASERRSPWGFVVPASQRDPSAARRMLETLAFGLVEVDRAAAPFDDNGTKYDAGAYIVRMQQPYSSFAKTLLERQRYPDLREYPGGPPRRPYDVTAHTLPLLMGVRAAALDRSPGVRLIRARDFSFTAAYGPDGDTGSWIDRNKPGRAGVYKSFTPALDEGWTRWILEEFRIPYESVRNPDVAAGALRRRFDVIVFPDQGAATIATGFPAGSMPAEYTGGLNPAAAENLRRFAEDGGTLVFLNHASDYAVDQLGLKLKNVLRGVAPRDFYCPGSLLNVRLENGGELARGMPREFAAWFEMGPAWEVPAGSPARVLARYPDSGILASGWLLGEKYLAGRAALIEYPIGRGRAILFGMRPQYRGQSWQTLKLLFNAFLPR